MKKTKIVIAGIGGVGGYFGGLLAKHFFDNENVEIIFVARGEHLKEIQKNGIKVIKGDDAFTAKANLATDNPSAIGIANFIIIATKSYDLESIVQQLKPCINKDTIILPLLNGVDSKERIKLLLPNNMVLDGCVYIVSRLKQNGVIENSGNIQKLYFGLDNFKNDPLCLIESLFKEANIEAYRSENISTVIWEKFIFLSPTATATCYFDKCIGELMANNEYFSTFTALIEEVKQLANAKQITISNDITQKTLAILESLPFETTSSMHFDFQAKKLNTELETLTGYVINEGQKYHLDMPTYKKIYAELRKQSGY